MNNYTLINVSSIDSSPVNQRGKSSADIVELSKNIKAVGLLHPVTVRRSPSNKERFELVSGERRLRAFKYLKRDSITANVGVFTDAEAHEITATENLQREDLTPLEEARSVKVLIGDGRDREEIADRLGKTVQWVSRRARLSDLIPCWIKACEDPNGVFFFWGALHLELIARYDTKKQKRIFDEINGGYTDQFPTMTTVELNNWLEKDTFCLSSTPWKLDDETLLPKAGCCSTCQNRSSCEPDLFDTVKSKKGVKKDFCLDEICWGKKLIAHNTIRVAALKDKHKNLILLTGNRGCSSKALPDEHPWKDVTQQEYNFDSAKKTDKGAVPAYVIDGSGTGQIKYVTPYSLGYSGSTPTMKGQPKPMSERRKALQKRRVIRYINKILQLLSGIEPCQPTKNTSGEMLEPEEMDPKIWKVPGRELTDLELFSLVAEFGASSNGDFSSSTKPWRVYESTLTLSDSEAFKIVFEGMVSKLVAELRSETNAFTPDKKFADKTCSALYLNSKKLWAMVLEEIKEPKIWSTLNADGTKKDKK